MRTPVNPALNVKFDETRGRIPEEFKDCIINGTKQLLDDIDQAPSCFCNRNEVCKQHAVYYPTIPVMIELVSGQIDEINKDETSFEQNLDFIQQSLESILFSRRDTFKEQLTRYYKSKDAEVHELQERINSMETEQKHNQTKNQIMKQQLSEIKRQARTQNK
jgi:hypothetical protein